MADTDKLALDELIEMVDCLKDVQRVHRPGDWLEVYEGKIGDVRITVCKTEEWNTLPMMRFGSYDEEPQKYLKLAYEVKATIEDLEIGDVRYRCTSEESVKQGFQANQEGEPRVGAAIEAFIARYPTMRAQQELERQERIRKEQEELRKKNEREEQERKARELEQAERLRREQEEKRKKLLAQARDHLRQAQAIPVVDIVVGE